MHQTDLSIVSQSNINSDVTIINQTDFEDDIILNKSIAQTVPFKIRMISTQERGLSRSRNMALRSSTADICLVADNDEVFVDSYKEIIKDAYKRNPKADVIAFALTRKNRTYPQKASRLGYISVLKISSLQISFRRKRIVDKGIQFDETMGSGTGNGGGEENKFLYDCLKKGLKIYYQPIIIAHVGQSDSQWFHGYTKKYFIDKGWAHKKIKGSLLGLITAIRFALVKHSLYKSEAKMFDALKWVIKGDFEQR
jgi:glycosyltransferase involved in cell wall biosynthesis